MENNPKEKNPKKPHQLLGSVASLFISYSSGLLTGLSVQDSWEETDEDVLVLASIFWSFFGIFFAVAMRGQSLELCGCVWVVVLYHPHHCQGWKEGTAAPGRKAGMACGVGKRGMWRVFAAVFHCPRLGEHFCLLYTSFIGAVTGTVPFLILLLFLVTCSYLKP